MTDLLTMLFVFWLGVTNPHEPPAQQPSIISVMNRARKVNGLRPLKENAQLNLSAGYKACDMSTENYFSHTLPDGTAWYFYVAAAGYEYDAVGENMARDIPDHTEVVARLLLSPGHRANILNPRYTEVGVAECGKYMVTHFGRPLVVFFDDLTNN